MIEILENKTLSDVRFNNNLLINQLKQDLYRITYFYDLVDNLRITKYNNLIDYSIPYSEVYDGLMDAVSFDLNLVNSIQEEIKNNIITSWNNNETKMNDIETKEEYDTEMILENSRCNLLNDVIYPHISLGSNYINNLAGDPIIVSKTNIVNIIPFLGKEWGVYNEDNVNNEDGIRVCDTSNLFVDNNFFEIEATVLNREIDGIVNFQNVTNNDLTLECSIKFIFNEPIEANYINIIPLNFSSNCYFEVTKIEIGDSINVTSIDVNGGFIYNEYYNLFNIPSNFIDGKIKNITFYFKQKNAYNLKYSVGYFKQNNNEAWLDITGRHVLKLAYDLYGDINSGVNQVIEDANTWIFSKWLPNIFIQEYPTLLTNYGNEGYKIITSKESNRKRYAIGISKIFIGKANFDNISEIITKDIEINSKYNCVEMDLNAEGTIYTYLSFDNGVSWHKIRTINDPDEKISNQIIINSDIDDELKNYGKYNTKTYVECDDMKLKVKFVLINDTVIPKIKKWDLKFSTNYEN